jgi:hypothetical protein
MTHNMKNKKGYHSNHISTEREVHKEMRKQTQKLQQYAKKKKNTPLLQDQWRVHDQAITSELLTVIKHTKSKSCRFKAICVFSWKPGKGYFL